jgi:glutathione S-transferase
MNLKGLKADAIYIHFDKGDQYTDAYRPVNPQSVGPALVLDDATVLTRSLPIIEYLEESYREPRLFLKFLTSAPLIGG